MIHDKSVEDQFGKHDNPYVRLRSLAQATLVAGGDIQISATGVSNTFKVSVTDAAWSLFIYAMITHLENKACAFEETMALLRDGEKVHHESAGRRRQVLRRDRREGRKRRQATRTRARTGNGSS